MQSDSTLVKLINKEVSDLTKSEIKFLMDHFKIFHSNQKGQWLARYHNMMDETEKDSMKYNYLRQYPFLSEGLKSFYIDKYTQPSFFDPNRSQIIVDRHKVGMEVEREYNMAMSSPNKPSFERALDRRMSFAIKTKQ